ncbi:MAG: hypothetical protein RSB61_02555 [Clostridia bacterium]
MKKTTRKVIVALSTLAVITLLYSYLCLILLPKSINDQGGDMFYRTKGFLAEPVENSLDVIAFGHSGVYSAFSPVTMYTEFGYTAYSSAAGYQTIDKINILIEQSKKVQKPKIILLDTDCLYLPPGQSNFWWQIGSPLVYHSRWKTLKAKDFYTFPGQNSTPDLTKGYYFSNRTVAVDPNNYMGKETATPLKLSRKNERELNKLVKFCDTHDVKLVLVDFANVTSWNYAKHNYIASYAEKKGVPFLDFNVAKDTFPIDFANNFRDAGDHYNLYGAEKATRFLGEYIKKNYGAELADKRNDPTFKYWEDAVAYYENLKTAKP